MIQPGDNKIMSSSIAKELEVLVERILGSDFGHGYPHVLRVWRWAYKIVESEGLGIDKELLDTAVLLHDIGRAVGEPHAYYSAVLAKGILSDKGYSSDFIDKVVNAILYHSFSYSGKHGIKPLTEEAKILSDADKLDALGVIGFLRVFYFSWQHNRDLKHTIQHFYNKILKLSDLMHYEYSRKKAIELQDKTRNILNELIREYEELGINLDNVNNISQRPKDPYSIQTKQNPYTNHNDRA